MPPADFQLPALQTPVTQTPEQNAQALALIENSRSLAEQRKAQAQTREAQAAEAARVAGIRAAWQAAMQSSQGDPDAAATALDKVNPDAASYGRAQTDAARKAALANASEQVKANTAQVGLAASLLQGIDPNDPNDYAAKVKAIRGMASNDPNVQKFMTTTLPLPGEPGFDPSKIANYIQAGQNASIPHEAYWKQMDESVKAANSGDFVKSLAYALDAEKNGSPQDLLKTIASKRLLGMKAETAQPFVDAITSGAYKADPLFFAKLGGLTNPEQAAAITGTIPGTTTPTEAAKKTQAELGMEGARLGVEQGQLKVAQDREARESAAAKNIDIGPDVEKTSTGRQYLDLGKYTTAERPAVRTAAANAGVVLLPDKAAVTHLHNIETARLDQAAVLADIQGSLPKDASGRIAAAPGILMSKVLQTDEQRAAFGAWRTSAINTLQALAGGSGSGLRINQAEIAMSLKNDIPQLTDTLATAQRKAHNIAVQLHNAETGILGPEKTIRMIAPDGTHGDVPVSQVEARKAQGAIVIGGGGG